MKNLPMYLSLLFAVIVLTSSKCGKGEGNSSWEGRCPLERLSWMKVSESYDSEKVVALAASLSAAAAADAKVIKGLNKLDAKTDFSSNLDKEVGKKSEKIVEVSREFYESYVRQRTSLCALFEALQTNPPIYTSVSARAKAEDAFTNVAQDFDNAKKEEEKKNQ